jgi:predicted dehydrogenase
MNVLLIGAGRMGLRHLHGLDGVAERIDVVDPRAEARAAALTGCSKSVVVVHDSVEAIAIDMHYDAGIIASTAAGRVETFHAVLALGVPAILLEKPLDQSRERARWLIKSAQSSGAKVWVNHYRRTLTGFRPLQGNGPFLITVSSGAMGLGVNGIHWIDFAFHLTAAKSGELLFGEIDILPIASGRGSQFCDYGGRGIFSFSDGSRLILSCVAASSAPTMISIVAKNEHWIVDQQTDRAWRHIREADVDHPVYLYGKDYLSETMEGLESVNLPSLTAQWARAVREGSEPPQPRAADVRKSYELLFDLLETSGLRNFHFT